MLGVCGCGLSGGGGLILAGSVRLRFNGFGVGRREEEGDGMMAAVSKVLFLERGSAHEHAKSTPPQAW